MNTDMWIAAIGAAVALTALGLAAFAVARMSRSAPFKVAVVITALTGFIAVIPRLIAAFASFRA
ncbi:hypothetical protein OU787_16845 [Kitasatospora sp. YST-16]|uniref:hypothetical protein n=1 Tax=Kitasatospora sp. YST-16 TaxID=2998080 RepID=UPI0022844A4C|nr:hypothetical protein [Kitasatospora sp. YST-16]WAL73024.1 hypothetical protein OU787_16845 [Kitasatospora sp. YST-16]WNW39075.1 hypothetical protein RKE32_16800 [Streptomyces sp. Li-HN-5-13]